MCILFIAQRQRKDYPLIIAANRDEFHARPTQSSHIWSSHPPIFAGKDLQAGGTWMGVTRSGRIAALTNIRKPDSENPQARSRGELVVRYLLSQSSDSAFTHELTQQANQFNGYNLLFGTWQKLQVFNNHREQVESVSDGVHGLSNASFNAPWPKVSRGVGALTEYCNNAINLEEEALFALLKDSTQAPDELLPSTGIEQAWEKRLSPIFIQSPEYGTRSSTLLLVKRDGSASWTERTFNREGEQINQANALFQFI